MLYTSLSVGVLVLALFIFIKTNGLVIGNFIIFIKKQTALRKEIKKQFEILPIEKVRHEERDNFNRGLLSNSRTIEDEDLEKKVQIIETMNPHLFKNFFVAIATCFMIVPLNIVFVSNIFNIVVNDGPRVIVYWIFALGVCVFILSLIRKAWLTLIFLSLAMLTESTFLASIMIVTFVMGIKKKTKN